MRTGSSRADTGRRGGNRKALVPAEHRLGDKEGHLAREAPAEEPGCPGSRAHTSSRAGKAPPDLAVRISGGPIQQETEAAGAPGVARKGPTLDLLAEKTHPVWAPGPDSV